MTDVKRISLQDLAKTYFANVGDTVALLKIMEECGELVRALSKLIALDNSDDARLHEAFSHAISECIDVYITLMWLLGSIDKEVIQQQIGQRLVEVLNKLELTQKLALDNESIQIEHGLPIGVRIKNVIVEKAGLRIVQ